MIAPVKLSNGLAPARASRIGSELLLLRHEKRC